LLRLLLLRLLLLLLLLLLLRLLLLLLLLLLLQLFPVVEQYLQNMGYRYAIGVDPKGKSGAFLVNRT
jgi:hypothetical protein